MNKIPKIHFILPGGGVRGAFQAGFLYQLFTKYKTHFEIARVDGTSVGSINGFAIMNDACETLKDTWLNINNINDLFDNWSDTSIIGGMQSLYYGYYNSGLFSNAKVTRLIESTAGDSWKTHSKEYQDKYSCAVVNLHNGKTKYVYGSDLNILDYITASASPWVVSNPVSIEDSSYADGGLLETYPIKHINKCDADITLILGYDQEHFNYISGDNANLLTYLANLIDIARCNSVNTQKLRDIIDTEDVVAIANPMTLLFVDFNREAIHDGFQSGGEFADSFYKTYIEHYTNPCTEPSAEPCTEPCTEPSTEPCVPAMPD
mgnify:FL=1